MSASAFEFRVAEPRDDAAVVELYRRLEPDGAPLSLECYQAHRRREPWNSRLVAVLGEELVGAAAFHDAWWTGQPGTFQVEVRVDPAHSGQGIGSRLYARLLAETPAARRLLAWVRADSEAGRGFAAHHGFGETGQVIQDYQLHLPEARTGDYAAVEDRLTREGVRILPLAELAYDEEAFLRALRRLWAGSEDDAADGEVSLEEWREQVLDGAGVSPETHWVALHGELPAGMTFLRRLSEAAFENDYTGVAPAYRGRGIAAALKLRAIAWAREHGASWFYTSSEVGNAPMIALNTRLGYVAGPQRLEVARDLDEP